MALTIIPTETDGSLGRNKVDLSPVPNLTNYVTAAEYNTLKKAVAEIAARLGLGDASQSGTIEWLIENGLGDRALARWNETDVSQFDGSGPRFTDTAVTLAGSTIDVSKQSGLGELLRFSFSRATNITAVNAPIIFDGPTWDLTNRCILRYRLAREKGLNQASGSATVFFGPCLHNGAALAANFWAYGLVQNANTLRPFRIEAGVTTLGTSDSLQMTTIPTDPPETGSLCEFEILTKPATVSAAPNILWFARSLGADGSAQPINRFDRTKFLGGSPVAGWTNRQDVTQLGWCLMTSSSGHVSLVAEIAELMLLKHPMDP